jgi:CheY-like chemotaxis protein
MTRLEPSASDTDHDFSALARERALRVERDGVVRRRVLLAEDDADLRWLLSEALQREGHDVVEVSSGFGLEGAIRDSLSRCESNRAPDIDLIVTDVRMPGRSGLDVLSWLQQTHNPIPSVVVSAFCSPEVRKRAEQLGVRAVVEKPLGLARLRELLRTIFAAT